MKMATLDLSVVICAYTEERWDALVEAVESVRRQSAPPREIIVVVDHNPRLLERAQAQIPGIYILANREPQGLSGARNSGIAAAGGKLIAFLDEDAVAAPDWLARLHAGYVDPQVIGVGGVIEPMWLGGRPAWFPEEFNWVVGCTYRGMPSTTAAVRNLIGCNMSFRREVFETIGGFRSGIGRIGTIPVGCEETELCIRAHQRMSGRVLRYEPGARVYHRVPGHRACWRYFRSRCYAEGRSKALVSRFVGARDGLASERTYTLWTLPQGMLRGVTDLFFRRNPAGLARMGAIVAGLAITAAGYLTGILADLWPMHKEGNQEALSQP
jgi:glucosyl-dolichyl phosphate glucuronosyltransferase